MNVSFESSKTLAGEGAILLLLGLIPTIGWVLGIVGIVLLVKAMKELSNYYQDEGIYKNTWTGLKYYIVALIAIGVASAIGVISFASVGLLASGAEFAVTAGFIIGLLTIFAGLVVAFIFYVLAASHLRKVFDNLAAKSGEASFTTAGTLLWWGSVLTIIGVGLVLILVAWIFATIGFFSMKPRQYQQYSPQYGYVPPPPQSTPGSPTQPLSQP